MSLKNLILILFVCISPPLSAEGARPVELKLPPVKEVRLRNGMKFLLVSRGEAPIFTAYIRFNVGGADEEPGKTGLAHFLEHMAFKGSPDMDEAELARRVESEGGQGYNATTSKDMTSYMVSFPSERLEFWAETESKRIFSASFRDFDRERQVILEERRMRVDDDPDGKLYEETMQRAFEGTPYAWPTLGTEKDLRAVTESDLKLFWETHYHPANAVGVIVGRFPVDQAEKILKKTFGKIPRGFQVYPPQIRKNPPIQETRFVTDKKALPRILVGYLKPSLPDRADYAFDLIEEILTEGPSSRLHKALVVQKRLVSNVSSISGVPGTRGVNLFIIRLEPLKGRTNDEVLAAYDQEISELREEGPTGREIERGVNRITSDLIWGLRSNRGLAAWLSFYEVAAGNWRYLAGYLDILLGVRGEEIRKTAQEWLDPARRIVGVIGS